MGVGGGEMQHIISETEKIQFALASKEERVRRWRRRLCKEVNDELGSVLEPLLHELR